ncbi:lysylphosphatidylglycerol synthase transmembrane domain-containing protein [Thalassobaculum salexigens]|uniref:lysylphosphatidylglycerol synthase transmembrane domain-containing protein n=1 Tax=Thalassobaculum salexigens TaxID=455360 RepID=UPI00042578FD|nr:lysylphosphatidylglycerol synthase transmembrane domain-containing protein [Thalassobaculum salexigens]
MAGYLKTGLKICVTLGLLAWVFSLVNREAVLAQLTRIDPVLGLSAVLAQCAQFPIGAWRWRMILAKDGVAMPFRDAFSFLMIGLLFNQVLPSTIGGDGVRVWLSARTGIGWSRAFGAVAVDRAAAIFMILVLSVPLLPVLTPIIDNAVARTSLTVLVLLGAAAVAVVLPLAPVVMGRLVARLPERRILRPLLAAAGQSAILWRRGSTTAVLSLCSVLILTSHVATVWLIALSMGVALDPLRLFALILPVMLLLAVPISIAGWGLREGLMVTALGFLDVDPSAAVAISLLWGGVTLFGGLLGGIALLLDRTDPATLFRSTGSPPPDEERPL